MNRIVSTALAFALAVIASFSFSFAETSDDVVVLYTNDVHCAIDNNIGYDGLALYKREMQALYKRVILVDSGDALQGGPIGLFSKGAYITELMNLVGYDVAAIGNHEFDYGVETLKKRAEEFGFRYVCCNFKAIETGEPVFESFKIIDAGEMKIAFIGVVTPLSLGSAKPVYFQNAEGQYVYSFCGDGDDLYEVVQANVDNARRKGADYVILLGHLGENVGVEKWRAQAVVENTTGIDAVIDAHSHEVTQSLIVKNKAGEPVTITQTGTMFDHIGKMTISKDGIATELIDRVPAPESSMGLDEATWTAIDGQYVDVAVNRKVSEINASVAEKLSEKVGRVDFDLCVNDPKTTIRRVRNGETNLADLVADALRETYKTDIALLYGGGVRNDVQRGEITYGDVLKAFPFDNKILSVKVSGRQILNALEFGAKKYPEEDPAFLSAVSGIAFTIDASVKSGVELDELNRFKRVNGEYRVKNVMIGGEPLDLEKEYSLCSNSFMLLEGGDGYGPIFEDCEIIEAWGESDVEHFNRYIRDELGGCVPDSYKDPKGQGRITIVAGVTKENSDVSND